MFWSPRYSQIDLHRRWTPTNKSSLLTVGGLAPLPPIPLYLGLAGLGARRLKIPTLGMDVIGPAGPRAGRSGVRGVLGCREPPPPFGETRKGLRKLVRSRSAALGNQPTRNFTPDPESGGRRVKTNFFPPNIGLRWGVLTCALENCCCVPGFSAVASPLA